MGQGILFGSSFHMIGGWITDVIEKYELEIYFFMVSYFVTC